MFSTSVIRLVSLLFIDACHTIGNATANEKLDFREGDGGGGLGGGTLEKLNKHTRKQQPKAIHFFHGFLCDFCQSADNNFI